MPYHAPETTDGVRCDICGVELISTGTRLVHFAINEETGA